MQQQRESVRRAWETVGMQPAAIRLRQQREELARLTAQARLDRALLGVYGMRIFMKIREQFAPASGYLRWRQVWNEMTGRETRLASDAVIWRGVGLADIVPKDVLGVSIYLPESTYGIVAPGDDIVVAPNDFPGLRLSAEVVEVGQKFSRPDSEFQQGDQPLTARRVYRVDAPIDGPSTFAGRFDTRNDHRRLVGSPNRGMATNMQMIFCRKIIRSDSGHLSKLLPSRSTALPLDLGRQKCSK